MSRWQMLFEGIRLAFWIRDELELIYARRAAEVGRRKATGQSAGRAAKASSDSTRK